MKTALALLATLLFAPQAAPNPKVQAEYEAFVKQADLEKHPERHAQVAAWCQNKNWKARADHHDLEYRRHLYQVEVEAPGN